MKYATESCNDPQYRKQLIERHRLSLPEFNAAISTFWQGSRVMDNRVSSAQMQQLLAEGVPGVSLVLCQGSTHYLNDLSLSLLIEPDPGKVIPAFPLGSFSGIYSYDLLFAVLTDFKPDTFVFYKASTPANNRSVIFKAVQNNQDLYLADLMNDIP